jgi:hypothetical protein
MTTLYRQKPGSRLCVTDMPGQFLVQSVVEIIEKDTDDPKLERRWDRDKWTWSMEGTGQSIVA